MSMLRTRFLKDYQARDNYGDIDETSTICLHLANSTWESDVLHIGMFEREVGTTEDRLAVLMNFTLEEVKELAAEFARFIQSAEASRNQERQEP